MVMRIHTVYSQITILNSAPLCQKSCAELLRSCFGMKKCYFPVNKMKAPGPQQMLMSELLFICFQS